MEPQGSMTVKLTQVLDLNHTYRDIHVQKTLKGSLTLSTPHWLNCVFMLIAMALLAVSPITTQAAAQGNTPACPSLLNHTFARLQDEKPMPLCQFSGQVILVVNTASYCGYTSQYDGLEKLNQRFKAQGFTVLGFPSNDFGKQEPKSNSEIADFCSNTFGVKFPMVAKSVVKGSNANPFYRELIQATGQEPGWNFHKYLIDRNGKVIGTYRSGVTPESPELTQAITRALAAPRP